MRVGNKVLLRLYQQAQKNLKAKGFEKRYPRYQFRKELTEALNNGKRTLHGVKLKAVDMKKISAVKDIEWPVLCGISNLILKYVNKWSVNRPSCIVEPDDLYNEAVASAINAIYYFTNSECFTTFVVHAIKRKLYRIVNKDTPLSGIGKEVKKLYGKMQQARREENGPITFDALVKKLKLTDNQRSSLEAMLSKVFRASELTVNSESESEEFDYTAIAKPTATKVTLDIDQRDAIIDAKLTDFETDVLFAFLSSVGNGWRAAVAKKHINPVTGKPYTRMTAANVLKKVKDKIRQAYKRGHAA
jgi:hypothetical protein